MSRKLAASSRVHGAAAGGKRVRSADPGPSRQVTAMRRGPRSVHIAATYPTLQSHCARAQPGAGGGVCTRRVTAIAARWRSCVTSSRPFEKPKSGRIAVKVINHLGDEVMKVFKV